MVIYYEWLYYRIVFIYNVFVDYIVYIEKEQEMIAEVVQDIEQKKKTDKQFQEIFGMVMNVMNEANEQRMRMEQQQIERGILRKAKIDKMVDALMKRLKELEMDTMFTKQDCIKSVNKVLDTNDDATIDDVMELLQLNVPNETENNDSKSNDNSMTNKRKIRLHFVNEAENKDERVIETEIKIDNTTQNNINDNDEHKGHIKLHFINDNNVINVNDDDMVVDDVTNNPNNNGNNNENNDVNGEHKPKIKLHFINDNNNGNGNDN